jgi:electron transfer flavoprotein alpha subunit
MPVLVFVETSGNEFKKAAREVVTYGKKIAEELKTETHVLCFTSSDNTVLSSLGNYGADKVWFINDARLHNDDPKAFATVIDQVAKAVAAKIVVFANNFTGKATAPVLAARLQAGLVSGAVGLPKINGEEFLIRKNVFSGKAISTCSVKSTIKIITLNSNTIPPEKNDHAASVEEFKSTLSDADFLTAVKEVVKSSGTISLSDAEIVVSGGRGLKGPENWGMLEDLAKVLGAATACSRPVADTNWRPHEEHVGQTGLTIRPNLYIAIGISGAIQHLAGVNGSKVIVVINKDPEAPFFKAADYGIVGDAFEVVPKLTEAFRKFKAGA